MTADLDVVFIIPVVTVNDMVRRGCHALQQLSQHTWQALVITNDPEPSPVDDPRVRVIASGRVGPADKRDLAARATNAGWLVFLDDDSYPQQDFLDALSLAVHTSSAAYGGPGVTPPDAGFMERVSGAVYSARLLGGNPARYVPFGPPRRVRDWPSVNLTIRRDAFLAVGGFGSPFWPGDDTFLCDKLTAANHVIEYRPELVVFHNRRPTLAGHLQQVGRYGLHRGYFARAFGASSRRVQYFVPTALVLTFALACLAAALGWLPWPAVGLLVMVYGCALLLGILELRRSGHPPAVCAAALPVALLTHGWYGVRFLQGLLTPGTLSSRLR
ncbi:MAG: glycosyltransferase [Actinomycetales bacterium]|nr:glycosyltransferase [Actinomycetales bacterium]